MASLTVVAAPSEQDSEYLTLLYTLRGHENAIMRALWMPDGGSLLSASIDTTLRSWTLEGVGAEAGRLSAPMHGFTEMAVTPDGHHAITATWNTPEMVIWDLFTGEQVRRLAGHDGSVNTIAVAPDGRLLSGANDWTLRLWRWEEEQPLRVLQGHSHVVLCCLIKPTGDYAISGAADGHIIVWDLKTGSRVAQLNGHTGPVNCLALAPDGVTLISGSDDGTLRVWDLQQNRPTRVLSGHTGAVINVAWSLRDPVIASRSVDGTVRVWRCDTWAEVARLEETMYRGRGYYPNGLAFHPTKPMLAALGEQDRVIRVWGLNFGNADQPTYTTRRIALVGDRGVGKTGLGFRLTQNKVSDSHTTSYYQTWVLDGLSANLDNETRCEAVLWDFHGQSDQQLVHTLLLDQVDVALLLFDPADWNEPLKRVEAWLHHLNVGRPQDVTRPVHKILVGARSDSAAANVTEAEALEFCRQHHIEGGYIVTSAHRGENIQELTERIRELLAWNTETNAVSEPLYMAARDIVLQAATQQALLTFDDLGRALDEMGYAVQRAEIRALAMHLASHGYVVLVGDTLLLKAELLLDTALTLINEARETRLATLDEARLWTADHPLLPDMRSVLTMQEREFLLGAALDLMRAHRMYYPEVFEGQRLLIFPHLLGNKSPLIAPNALNEDVSFRVKGEVGTIFASLVVLINQHKDYLMRSAQGSNWAQFQMGPDEICSFWVNPLAADTLDIILGYGPKTPLYTREMFSGLIKGFLSNYRGEMMIFPVVDCPNCGQRQARQQVVGVVAAGGQVIYCAKCGCLINLNQPAEIVETPRMVAPIPLIRSDAPEIPDPDAHHRVLRYKIREFFAQRNFPTPTCYISFAWGVSQHEDWVVRFADHLREAGIEAIYDYWNLETLQSNEEFLARIEASDVIVIIGTPLYRSKFEKQDGLTGSVVPEEVGIIHHRLATAAGRDSLIALLLDGDADEVFPSALSGVQRLNMSQERTYFATLIFLMRCLYNAPTEMIDELRAYLR